MSTLTTATTTAMNATNLTAAAHEPQAEDASADSQNLLWLLLLLLLLLLCLPFAAMLAHQRRKQTAEQKAQDMAKHDGSTAVSVADTTSPTQKSSVVIMEQQPWGTEQVDLQVLSPGDKDSAPAGTTPSGILRVKSVRRGNPTFVESPSPEPARTPAAVAEAQRQSPCSDAGEIGHLTMLDEAHTALSVGNSPTLSPSSFYSAGSPAPSTAELAVNESQLDVPLPSPVRELDRTCISDAFVGQTPLFTELEAMATAEVRPLAVHYARAAANPQRKQLPKKAAVPAKTDRSSDPAAMVKGWRSALNPVTAQQIAGGNLILGSSDADATYAAGRLLFLSGEEGADATAASNGWSSLLDGISETETDDAPNSTHHRAQEDVARRVAPAALAGRSHNHGSPALSSAPLLDFTSSRGSGSSLSSQLHGGGPSRATTDMTRPMQMESADLPGGPVRSVSSISLDAVSLGGRSHASSMGFHSPVTSPLPSRQSSTFTFSNV